MASKKLLFLYLVASGISYTGNILNAVIDAQVELHFLPQDQLTYVKSMTEMLNNAKNQILVAMYLITDEQFIKRLIELSKNGINVQVILDETSQEKDNLVTRLKENNIEIYVNPTLQSIGNMHNKYIVIDNQTVSTGSSNLTKSALDPYRFFKNNENIIVMNSQDVAQKYHDNFMAIKKGIKNKYINIIANNLTNDVPKWIKDQSNDLFLTDREFYDLVYSFYQRSSPEEKNNILNFFPTIGIAEPPEKVTSDTSSRHKRKQPLTQEQQKELEETAIILEAETSKDISKKEATKIIRQKKAQPY